MRNLFTAFLLILLLLAAVPLASMQTSAQPPNIYEVSVNAPSSVYTGQQFSIYVNCTYGWGNYSVSAYFAGYNLTGFLPTSTYHNFSLSDPYFIINVSAPLAPQTLYVYITTYAQVGSKTVQASSTQLINVFTPIVLNATVSNPSNVAIHNVTVNFLIDWNGVGHAFIPVIGPGASVPVSIKAVYPQLSQGEHTLSIDVSNAQVLVNGKIQYSTQFYYGTPPNYSWIYYVSAGSIIFAVLLALGAGRRKNRLSSPKWKK